MHSRPVVSTRGAVRLGNWSAAKHVVCCLPLIIGDDVLYMLLFSYDNLCYTTCGCPVASNFVVQDKIIPWEDWPNYKPGSPFGQMPYIEVDGKVIAQSAGIGKPFQIAPTGAHIQPSFRKGALSSQLHMFSTECCSGP